MERSNIIRANAGRVLATAEVAAAAPAVVLAPAPVGLAEVNQQTKESFTYVLNVKKMYRSINNQEA